MRLNSKLKKASLRQIASIQVILFGTLIAFSLYQVLNCNLFPWLNLSVIFGSSFLSLIFVLVVKIQLRIIQILILAIASIQIFMTAFFMSQHEMLRTNWQWLFFPLTIVFCLVFLDLLSRRTDKIKLIGQIFCSLLFILTFFKFFVRMEWIDSLLIGFVTVITIILLFSKNRPSEYD